MTKISLEWIRYPDSTVTAVRAEGLTDEQLYHYARQVGFSTFQPDSCRPLLVGSIECCDELLAFLESAGYEIAAEEITMPEAVG